MMDAMEHKMDLLPPAASRDKMKDESVKNVFGEAPNYQAENKKRNGVKGAHLCNICFLDHVGDNREVYYRGYRGMNMRKDLEEITLEHPRGFIIVGDITLHCQTPFSKAFRSD